MDILLTCLIYLFKISLYIIVIGGALVTILLIYILIKIIRLVNLFLDIAEDINQKYFLIESFFSKPFKFITSLFDKRK